MSSPAEPYGRGRYASAARKNEPVVLNDFVRQWAEVGAASGQVFDRVGRSGWYILGNEVARFEAALAAYWGLPSAIGTGNGLDAIEIALRSAGLLPGDRVMTSPLSAFATSLAVARAGGVPVFVDVDDRGLIDLGQSRALLEADPTLRFMVPVHLYGRPLDLDALEGIKKDYGVTVIEDCAQSIGATWKGRPTGSVGSAAATSFYPTKNLGALGDGGGLLTADEGIAERARSLRHYGQEGTYRHTRLGMNSRLDELHAALLCDVLLPRLDEWTARRRRTAERYLYEIRHPLLLLPVEPPEASPCWHLFPVLVDRAPRGDFMSHLSRSGVASAVHYPTLIPDQLAWSGSPGIEVPGRLDQATRFAFAEVSLPIHPFLDDEEIVAVIAACNSWDAK